MADPRHETKKKRRIFGVLLLLWLLPAIQSGLNMKVFRAQPPGYEAPVPRPVISIKGLWSSSFQSGLEQYATQKLGFRKWLLRPRNQVIYSLFNKMCLPVVQGRHGMLFEKTPLLAALGRVPALSPAEVQARVQRLRVVQDTLARRGKLLLFVIAPSKASIYPENWPDSCQGWGHQLTNYERLRGPLQASGINLLDLGTVFRTWKKTSPYPLFPQGGIHWSAYGLTRAADTLRRFFNARSRFHLPAVRQTGLRVGEAPRGTDDDLLKLQNMFFDPLPNPPLAYPDLVFAAPAAGQPLPRVLLIADSFAWSMIEFYPYLDSWFGPGSQFWFYNNEVAWSKEDGGAPVSTVVAEHDLRAELASHDVVLLLFSEQSLLQADFGFTEKALLTFGVPAP